ncbi:MAG TPA: MarR family transcriptional regulator [Baekduia sp.]|nr:MarR family transcriptional regulator [Baekduia sp.]
MTAEQLVEELIGFFGSTMRSSQGDVFRVVSELDLSMTQLKLLHVLDNAERELTPSELAKRLDLSPAAAGRAVDALTRQGLVARREDEEDRRVKRLSLTSEGSTTVGRIAAARRDGFLRLAESLTPPQREALSSALQPLLTPLPNDCAARAEDPR